MSRISFHEQELLFAAISYCSIIISSPGSLGPAASASVWLSLFLLLYLRLRGASLMLPHISLGRITEFFW
jgi:hypothetical protein